MVMRWQAPDDFSKHLRRASTPAECLLWQLVRNRTQWLNRQGVEVIRFTSNEIENDTQRVLLEIDVVLKRLLIQDTPPHPPTPSPPEEEKGS